MNIKHEYESKLRQKEAELNKKTVETVDLS